MIVSNYLVLFLMRLFNSMTTDFHEMELLILNTTA